MPIVNRVIVTFMPKRHFYMIDYVRTPIDSPYLPHPKPHHPYEQDPPAMHRFTPQGKTRSLKNSADKEFMEEQVRAFHLGKRHLANMMGFKYETMTQSDVDMCIRYLFPTGLTKLNARPMMKHPEEIFPSVTELEIDRKTGRPKNPFHFCGAQKSLASAMYQVAHAYEEAEFRYRNGVRIEGSGRFYKWMSSKDLPEELPEKHYDQLIQLLDKLRNHPLADMFTEVLNQYSTPEGRGKSLLSDEIDGEVIDEESEISPSVKWRSKGCQASAFGHRKTATAKATVNLNEECGKPKGIFINGSRLDDYFVKLQDRNQVMFPLMYGGFRNCGFYNIKVSVKGGGTSGQAGAARLAIGCALNKLATNEDSEYLRLTGMLTKDVRVRERKKFSQHGARKLKSWRKR